MSQNSYIKKYKAKTTNTYRVPWISIANHMILFRFMLSSVIRKRWQIICFQLICLECFEPDFYHAEQQYFQQMYIGVETKTIKISVHFFSSMTFFKWLFFPFLCNGVFSCLFCFSNSFFEMHLIYHKIHPL